MVKRNNIYGEAKINENNNLEVFLKNTESHGGIAGNVDLYYGSGNYPERVSGQRMQSLNGGEEKSVVFEGDLKDGEYRVFAFVSDYPIFRFEVENGEVTNKKGKVISKLKNQKKENDLESTRRSLMEKVESLDQKVNEMKKENKKLKEKVEEKKKERNELKHEIRMKNRETNRKVEEVEKKAEKSLSYKILEFIQKFI